MCFRKGAVSIDLTESQRRNRPGDKWAGLTVCHLQSWKWLLAFTHLRIADTFEHIYINSLNLPTVKCQQYYYSHFTVGEIKALIKFACAGSHNQKVTGQSSLWDSGSRVWDLQLCGTWHRNEKHYWAATWGFRCGSWWVWLRPFPLSL